MAAVRVANTLTVSDSLRQKGRKPPRMRDRRRHDPEVHRLRPRAILGQERARGRGSGGRRRDTARETVAGPLEYITL